MVVPDGHLLYRWHYSRYAIWRVYAACQKIRPVGNQTKITKVSIGRFSCSQIIQLKIMCIQFPQIPEEARLVRAVQQIPQYEGH